MASLGNTCLSPALRGPSPRRSRPTAKRPVAGGPRPPRLLRPVRVLDDVHKAGALVPGYESVQDIRLDIAERRCRLGCDTVRERLEDAPLEVRAGVQGGNFGPQVVTDIVVSDAEHIVFHP